MKVPFTFPFEEYVVYSPGNSVFSVVGPIGQSLDREQVLIQIAHPDGSVEMGLGDFSGLIRFLRREQ